MKSLDDILDLLCSKVDYAIFIDELDETLEALPITRDSAEAVLNEVDQYDILELYNVLFDKFEDYMTECEKEKIIAQYKRHLIYRFSHGGRRKNSTFFTESKDLGGANAGDDGAPPFPAPFILLSFALRSVHPA